MIYLPSIFFFLYFLLSSFLGYFFVFRIFASELSVDNIQMFEIIIFSSICLFLFFLGNIFANRSKLILHFLYKLNINFENSLSSINIYKSAFVLYVFSVFASILTVRNISNVDYFRSLGNQSTGITSVWVGPPLLISAIVLFNFFTKKCANIQTFLLIPLPILLTSILPLTFLQNRGVIFVWFFSICISLISPKSILQNLTSLFRGSSRIDINTFLLLILSFLIFISVIFVSYQRDLFSGSSEFITSFLRVDGVSAISRIMDFKESTINTTNYLQILTEPLTIFIPRIIWENKPIPLSLKLAQNVFPFIFLNRGWDITGGEGGVSPTFFGEILFATNYISTYIFSFLWGVFGYVIGFLIQNANSFFMKLIFAFIAGNFILSAEIYSIFTNAIIVVIFTSFLIYFIGRFLRLMRI